MTMAGTGDGSVRALRALTAVVALYALVMQAVLGGIAALPIASPIVSPLASPFDATCLGTAGPSDPASPQAPAHDHACCCTAAHPAAGTPPPLPATASVAWPPRLVIRLVWRSEGTAAARAPPGTLASARGPPAA